MRDFMIGGAIVLGLFLSIQFYWKVDEINKHLINIEKSTSALNVINLIPGVGTDGRKP